MSTFDLLLVPAASQYRKYNKIIHSLSKKYDTPSFPHITILNMLEADEKDLVAKVKKIARYFKQIEVAISGINFSNTHNQCVFAQIKMSPLLSALYEELKIDLQYSDKSPFFPHMSLVYGKLSREEKLDIASHIELDHKLLLDKLAIYRYGPLKSDWKPVAKFELN